MSKLNKTVNELLKDENQFEITVKNASNPVLVNGQEITIGSSTYLNYGDTILVGNTTLTFKRNDK